MLLACVYTSRTMKRSSSLRQSPSVLELNLVRVGCDAGVPVRERHLLRIIVSLEAFGSEVGFLNCILSTMSLYVSVPRLYEGGAVLVQSAQNKAGSNLKTAAKRASGVEAR